MKNQYEYTINSTDDMDVADWGDSKVYLPSQGTYGSEAWVHVEGDADIIRGAAAPASLSN